MGDGEREYAGAGLSFLAEKFAFKEEAISERNHDAGPHTALEESLDRFDYLRGRQVHD
jgi:hypothetical protein